MNYKKCKQWLNSLGMRMSGFNLETIKKLCELSEIDVEKFKTIHVAGSNGKGSTCAFIEQILQEQGYKTGFYSSPHLIEDVERIKINGKNIPENRFVLLAKYFIEISEKNNLLPSYFEILTAIALKYFAEEKIDFLVAEVGLGGRLDATNVLNGMICAITSLSLEHTQYLGNTVEKIAKEKAGIIKENSVVIVAKNNPGRKTIEKKAKETNAQVIQVEWKITSSKDNGNEFNISSPLEMNSLKTKMIGAYQCENAALATAACLQLRNKMFEISENSIRKGIGNAFWPGRMEKIQQNPLIVFDAAHNPSGWNLLLDSLKLFEFDKLIIVFGAMKDKEIIAAKPLLMKASRAIITVPKSERAAPAQTIRNIIGLGEIETETQKAFEKAIKSAQKNDLILITGSIYLLGDAYRYFKKNRLI